MSQAGGQPVRFLPDWLGQRALHNPTQIAIESPNGTWTYKALYDAACQYAASLRNLGIERGERVAVLTKRGDLYALVLHALIQLDAVIVPLNWRLTGSELAMQVSDSGSIAVLYDQDAAALANSLREHTDIRTVAIDDLHAGAERLFRIEVDLLAPHAIIYTSGTTGVSKGAVISYQNHYWGAMASALQLGLRIDDKWLVPMPLFHVGGMAVLIRSVIYGTTVVIQNGFREEEVNRALDEERITLLSVVPAMLSRMLADRSHSYPASLRSILLGGSSVPKALLERAHELAVPINQSYGMTETNTQATTLQSHDALRKLGSSGKPLPNTEVRIACDHGLTMQPGVEGEIVVRGPTVIQGYYQRPEANEKSFQDGWFYTGDIGVFDDEGYLYVLDRRADLIVSGGENVYPAEVESVLSQAPGVREAAVVGRSDAVWGQVPVAFVVANGDVRLSSSALEDFCASRLARYKVPKAFMMVDSLPRNASGKLLRRVLKEQLPSWNA